MSPPAAGLLPLGEPGPHVRVADVDVPVLDNGDRHHLTRVLRLRPGAVLTVSDGRGRWRRCRFGPGDPEPDGEVFAVPAPRPPVTVAFALVKGARPELVVQKLTEVGVDRIVPFVAERSVVRWDEARAERNHARLERIAHEAASQSKRVWWPEVAPVVSFAEVAAGPDPTLADLDGAPLTRVPGVVLVGPEGGWSDGERALACPRIGLGPTVLRAETAAIAVGVLLVALRAGTVSAPVDP